ncbi:hypothetical protein M1O47_04380, partial [Dehalococcoidia bacterium]|nr:hypothetical protein [Dehalococcoidia bacterium]
MALLHGLFGNKNKEEIEKKKSEILGLIDEVLNQSIGKDAKDPISPEEEKTPAEFTPRPTTPSTFPAELQPKYRDVKYLSKGGFARVFRANRISDGRTVALKV